MDLSKHATDLSVPLESVLCTDDLKRWPARFPDYQAESLALETLAQAMADSPGTILQTLAEKIVDVVHSDSAVVSLLTIRDSGRRFYWPATAGEWRRHLGGGTPRDFGPCGDVLARDAPLLFTRPHRRYKYLEALTPLIEECLIVPFYVMGKPVGTIWAISHDDRRKFDAEDERILACMGRFASAAHQAQLTFHASGQLAAIVESSDDAIVAKDLQGIITSWNAGAERLYGYSADEAIGRPITMIIPDDRLDEVTDVLERIRRGEHVGHYETTRRRKDGSLVNISLTVSPIKDARGRIVGLSKTARDISERIEADKLLREADRRKSEFLAILAHELRNPLAPIRHAIRIMQRTPVDGDTGRSAMALLDRQVEHVVRLVDDLLDVSRINRGQIDLRKEKVDLSSVLSHAVEFSRPLCESTGQTLTVVLPSTPIYLDADPIRLAQVVGNLLNNACKFSDRGGHIRLTVAREGDQVEIRIKDTGLGIAPEQMANIFEMFTQVDTSVERSRGGLGIGLTLVKRLVEMHDGTVVVQSEGAGKGSEFIVRLPVAPQPAAPPADKVAAKHRTTTRRRILVVDDSQDAAMSLAMLLKLNGHDVEVAHDGLEAVDMTEKFRPDVVLLDIGLPRLNGWEAARRIRSLQQDSALTLVALTGWGQDEDRRRTAEAGFDMHMVKPVDFAALTRLLEESNAERKA